MKSFKSFLVNEVSNPKASPEAVMKSYKDLFIRILQDHQLTYDSTNDSYLKNRPDLMYCEYAVHLQDDMHIPLHPPASVVDGDDTIVRVHPSTMLTVHGQRSGNLVVPGTPIYFEAKSVFKTQNSKTTSSWHSGFLNWPYSLYDAPFNYRTKYSDIWESISNQCEAIWGRNWLALHSEYIRFDVNLGPDPIQIGDFYDPYVIRLSSDKGNIKNVPGTSYKDPFEIASGQSEN
jgi:hypothetical protein